MIGYKVLSKDGLKGPFKKSSILKAISSAVVPLQARLLEMHTGRYIVAAELVGEQIDTRAPKAATRPEVVVGREGTHIDPKGDTLKALAEQTLPKPGLTLAEESPAEVVETPRVLLVGKIPLKKARMPKPRKLAELHA